MPRSLAALLALLALLALAPVAGGQVPQATDQTAELSVDANRTTMTVQLRPDGTARWTVSTTFDLNDTNDTTTFRQLASEFEDGETVGLGLDAFRQASEAASLETGREMAITDVVRTHSVENGTGTLTLRFTWTNFARRSGDRLYVGDAFNTSSGTWLSGLRADQTLVIEPPADYGVDSAPIGFQNGTIRWEGPTTFPPGYLTVTFSGQQPSSPSETPVGPGQGDAVLWGVLVVAGVGVAAVALYALSSRDGDVPVPAPSDGEAEAAEEAPPPEEPEPEADEVDEELLSDEERIERMLEQRGGRMKQAAIVRETGWSNAKVSQLLSAMDDAGRVDKLRIGRENLISLPDQDVGDIE